jgi:hypothetical protein
MPKPKMRRGTSVTELLDEDFSTTKSTSQEGVNKAVSVLQSRVSGDDSLRDLQEKGDMIGWIEQAFEVTLAPQIQEMIESFMNYEVTVALSANSMGKTHAAARLALAWYKWGMEDADVKDVEVFTAAAPPENNLKRLLWGEINAALYEAEETFHDDQWLSLHVEGGPNSYVTGVTIPSAARSENIEARFSGKHADWLGFIFDEGDAIPSSVYDGSESCMSGGSKTRMLIMLNPRAPRGPVYRMVQEGQANVVHLSALKHPNVVQGKHVIPGAVTRETVVRRIADWSRPKDENENAEDRVTFEVPEYLIGCHAERKDGTQTAPLPPGERVVVNPNLCHMVLGVYPKKGSHQLIAEDWVEAAFERWEQYVDEHGADVPTGAIMGYDVASTGADQNMICLRKNDFVPEFRWSWTGVDADVGASRAASVFQDYHCYAAKIDATGLGDGVSTKMRREGVNKAHGFKANNSPTDRTEEGEFLYLRDQLAWRVREWLRPRQEEPASAMLPRNEMLKEELTELQYDTTQDGKIRVTQKDQLRETLGRSPDMFDSLALTFAPDKRHIDTANWSDPEFEARM